MVGDNLNVVIKKSDLRSKIKEFRLTIDGLQVLQEDVNLEDYARGQMEVYERMVELMEGLL